MKYLVDIGCCECGDRIEVEADAVRARLVRAGRRLDKEAKHCRSGEEPYVVQVFLGDRAVWDFINGGLGRDGD